jgi:tape measure protein
MSFDPNIGTINVDLVGDGSKYQNMLRDATKSTEAMGNTLSDVGKQFLSIQKHIENAGWSFMALGGVVTAVGYKIKGMFSNWVSQAMEGAGKFESTTIAFETMLGSAVETKKTLADLTKFAAETPFTMPEVEAAARGLITFGERGDELMTTLKLLGNAASGTSTSFGEVALIFNQIRGVGHLLTQDFRQLSTRGILSLDDIAKHYKTTTQAAQGMLSAGKITFPEVKKIFDDMSKAGGRFANLMERQSTSFLGLKSTLSDSFGIMLRQIGEQMTPVAKVAMTQMINLTAAFSNMSEPLKKGIALTLGLGAAMGSLLVTVGALTLSLGIFGQSIKGLSAFYSVFKSITLITGFLFTGLSAIVTPLGVVVLGIAAIGGAIAVLMNLDLGKMWTKGIEEASKWVMTISGFVDNLQENLGILWSWLQDTAHEAWWNVRQVSRNALEYLKSLFSGDFLKGLGDMWGGVSTGAADAWQSALKYGHQFFSNTLGFFQNLSYNVREIFDFISKNWDKILYDMATLSGTIFVNIAYNVGVAVEMFMRFWEAGLRRLVQAFQKTFTVDTLMWVNFGLLAAAEKVAKWAVDIAKMVSKLGDLEETQAVTADTLNSQDARDGLRTQQKELEEAERKLAEQMAGGNFLTDLRNITEEQRKKMVNLTSGWESSITDSLNLRTNVDPHSLDLPKFNLDPTKTAEDGAKDTGTKIGQALASGMTEPLKDVKKSVKEATDVKAILSGSLEHYNLIKNYMEGLEVGHVTADTAITGGGSGATTTSVPPTTVSAAEAKRLARLAKKNDPYNSSGMLKNPLTVDPSKVDRNQKFGTPDASLFTVPKGKRGFNVIGGGQFDDREEIRAEETKPIQRSDETLASINERLGKLVEIATQQLDKDPIEFDVADIA